MNWKKFSQEFPKHGQLILAVKVPNRILNCIMGIYSEDAEADLGQWEEFTHWMPFPDLPILEALEEA